MSDIVKRLRSPIRIKTDYGLELDRREAADRIEQLEARLAEAERNEGTLLGMIRHQQDVLRECLPYLNESMAGRRPGRSADDIRAAVKALTADSANERRCECGERLSGHEDESSTKCRWCVTGWKPSKDDQADSATGEGEK